MIIGLGIDIVDQIRIGKGIEKHGQNFTNRLFTSKQLTATKVHVSLSHVTEIAAAVVILEN